MSAQKIKIVKETKVNFRTGSARDLYYQVLAAHDGKTVDSFIKTVAANPPSVPGRGKLAGKPEPVQGWLAFFVREAYCEIS